MPTPVHGASSRMRSKRPIAFKSIATTSPVTTADANVASPNRFIKMALLRELRSTHVSEPPSRRAAICNALLPRPLHKSNTTSSGCGFTMSTGMADASLWIHQHPRAAASCVRTDAPASTSSESSARTESRARIAWASNCARSASRVMRVRLTVTACWGGRLHASSTASRSSSRSAARKRRTSHVGNEYRAPR